jgi:hypothetical protein
VIAITRPGEPLSATRPLPQSTVVSSTAAARSVLRVEQRKPAKRSTTVRLAPAGHTKIAERAARADVDFSHMVRRMLAYADRHMPDGWTPTQDPTAHRVTN